MRENIRKYVKHSEKKKWIYVVKPRNIQKKVHTHINLDTKTVHNVKLAKPKKYVLFIFCVLFYVLFQSVYCSLPVSDILKTVTYKSIFYNQLGLRAKKM